MKKNDEEFDLEVAIERVQKKFLYEDVIKKLEEQDTNNGSIDFDEYEESVEFEWSDRPDPEDDPAMKIVEEMLDWYEKHYGKLSKSEKDELKIEICYNYEIEME